MTAPVAKVKGRWVDVEVTEDMIRTAVPRDSGHCMIADAIRAAIPGAKHPAVDLATARFTDPEKGLRYTYLTPPAAQTALVRFDQGLPIEPFRFRLQRAIQITKSSYTKTADGKRKAPSRRREGTTKLTGGAKAVPTIVGGPSLPNAALATGKGRIRAFGLRQLKA